MNIRKYLPDERDPQKVIQQMDCGTGNVITEAIRKRREEKIESLLELPVEQVTEREIASRLGEIRGLKFLKNLVEECQKQTDKE